MANENNKDLEKLLENSVLSEEVKASITEAWENRLQEVKEEAVAEVRDEFSQKFEKDKSEIVEAIDTMIHDHLTEQIKDLEQEKKNAVAERIRYNKSIKEHTSKLDKFAKNVLEKEMSEFIDDRKAVAEKVKNIDSFVSEAIGKVVNDYHDDRQKLAEDRVKFRIRSKQEINETKERLVKQTAIAVEKFVKETISSELEQLKDELAEAKKNNFGRKIYEAFAADFLSSFFNENAEMKKLTEAIEERDRKIEEILETVKSKEEKLDESAKQVRIANARIERMKIFNDLLGSFGQEKREIMEDLLKDTPNDKLEEQFHRYLPTLLEETRSDSESVLTESKTGDSSRLKEVTGDKPETEDDSGDSKRAISEFVESSRKLLTR